MADEQSLFDSVFTEMDKGGTYKPDPTPTANPLLSDAIDEVGTIAKLPQNIAAIKAKDANPDQYQKLKAMSDKVGLDVGFVDRNFPELERQQKTKDIQDIGDKVPELGQWFAQGDNPAAIKVDELRHLSGLGWMAASFGQSFSAGRDQVEFGRVSTDAMRGVATPDELARADQLFNGMEPRTYGADSWLQDAWVTTAQQLPTLASYLFESAKGGAAGFAGGAATGATWAAVAGQLGPQAATPEEVVTVPGAALATGMWTGRAGAISAAYLYSFQQTAGPAYFQFKNMKDENGVPMDDDVAKVAAYVTGALGAGLEVVGTEKIASLVPGADKLTGMFTKDAVAQALTIPSVREAFKTFAKGVGEAGITEISTEVAQQAVQIFTQEMAKQYANTQQGAQFGAIGADEVASQLLDTANQTAKTMVILGPALAGTRLGADLKKANSAGRDSVIIDTIVQHAVEDELLKRLPEKAQEGVKHLAEDGPVPGVFVQPEGIKTLFQNVEDMNQFIDAVGIRDEWNEASAIGRDVHIPIDVFYAKIAATPAAEALRPYMKINPDSMTISDAEVFNEAWQAAQESLVSDHQAQSEVSAKQTSGTEFIADDVKQKAMDAGIVPDQAAQYSKLYSTFFRVMSERTGFDPQEIYNRYGFDINRALPGGTYKPLDALDISLAAVRSGRIPSIRKQVEKAKGASLLDRVAERGGIEDTGGELKAMGLKGKRFVRPPKKNGDMRGGASNANTADDMARQLWEEGYFPNLQERPTPNDLYDAIGEELGGQKRYSAQVQQGADIAELGGLVAFADTLDELGLDPARMSDEEIKAEIAKVTNRDATSGAMFQGRELFQGGKRGSIQLSEGRSVINLFDEANLSTFLHESGHFFLEVFKDLASSQGAPGELMTDWAITKDYLGITEADTIPVEAHEKFARTFEAYLFEGKAPSPEVASIMARFRSWLVFVYKQVQALNAPINDKIRGVMDRLIATDSEIHAATTAPEFKPVSALREFMTDAQWQDYQAVAGRAVDGAKRQMDARMMADVARETSAEWREAKREIRERVTADLSQQPVYRVMNYLRTGEWGGNAGPAERLFLDRDDIVSVMGEGALERMPRSVPPMYRAKGGVHPDYMAELFDFSSGHEMLTQMMSVPSLGRAIASETDVRMKEKFGDLMGDAVARIREATEAMTSDETGELLNKELEVAVRKGMVATKLRKEDAQRAARRLIRDKPIREAMRQKLYMNANSKAAQDFERAVFKQDWKAAVEAKQRQLVNHYMALEAVNAKKDVESTINYLAKFTGRKRPTKIDAEYLDQIEALLERFDFRKSISLTEGQRRTKLAAWITKQEELGAIVQIPDALRDDAFRKPYRDMTVDDLLGLRDTVKNIEHLGRLKDRLLSNKAAREFASARDEVVASIQASQAEKKTPATRNPTEGDKALSLLKSADASLMKIEQVIDWMDGGDVNGPLNRTIWRPIADAQARENDLQAKYTAKFIRTLEKLDKRRLNERVGAEGVTQKMHRSEVMAVALNLGNEGNLDKMKRGEVWDDATIKRLTDNLNAEEWQAVQEIWDIVNELWPEIAALQKRLTGVEPIKVQPREVDTPYGKLQGGYYPLIYDPNRSADVEDRNAANADKMFENTYLRPDTFHGFVKERTKAYTRPLLFDLDAAGNHLISVIHDLTHREAIIDANKMLTNADVRAEIENRYGKEIYRQFVPWLQAIAHDRTENDGLSAVNKVLRGVRSRATMVGMGFRLSTMITQVVGYSSSAEMVNPKALAGSMKDFMRHPLASSAMVNELSGEMRHRSANLDRDIRDQIRKLTGKNAVLDQVRKFAYVGIGYMDRVVTVPTWMAAYKEHLAQYPGDKDGAVAKADQVVRLTGGSGGAKDLPAIMRGPEGVKLLTMFYSYFSAYYNRQRAWGRDARRAIENGEYSDFPSLLARQVFMTIGPALLADLIVGKGPSGDDDSWAKWAARKVAFYPLIAVPLVRDAFGAVDSGFGYNLSPAGRTVSEIFVDPIKMMEKIINPDKDVSARELVKQTLETTGYALKLPTGQLATTTNNVWKAIEQDDFKLSDLVLTRQHK